MKHSITPGKPLFGKRGIDLIVRLQIEPHERKLIRDNNMERVILVEREPSFKYVTDREGKKQKIEVDNNIYLRIFTNAARAGTAIASWTPTPSTKTSWLVSDVLRPTSK